MGTTYKIYNGGANYNGTSAYALNADTVDGYHASYFMPISGGSFTGCVKFTTPGYSQLLYIDVCAIGFNRNTTVGGRFDSSLPGYQFHIDFSSKCLWLGCEYNSWTVCGKFDYS